MDFLVQPVDQPQHADSGSTSSNQLNRNVFDKCVQNKT